MPPQNRRSGKRGARAGGGCAQTTVGRRVGWDGGAGRQGGGGGGGVPGVLGTNAAAGPEVLSVFFFLVTLEPRVE